jgi:hypothetical protein
MTQISLFVCALLHSIIVPKLKAQARRESSLLAVWKLGKD